MVSKIRKLNVNFVCLLETRIKEHKLQGIINKQFPGWSLFHNYLEAFNGGIWMLWKGSIYVTLLAITDQSITCKIQMDSKVFFLQCHLWIQ